MRRFGTRPQQRSTPDEQSLNNGTCPDILEVNAEKDTFGVGAVAFVGTVASAKHLKKRVVHEQQKNLRDRLAIARDVTYVVLTRSTILDANPDVEVYAGAVPVINLGFPTIEDPRDTSVHTAA